MRLGNFSVSLAVKNLAASRAFYEILGFRAIGGDPTQNWLILQNGTTTIGVFQGMFGKNLMTFNPGWSSTGERLADYDDVRDIQRVLTRTIHEGEPEITAPGRNAEIRASSTGSDRDGLSGRAITFEREARRAKWVSQ